MESEPSPARFLVVQYATNDIGLMRRALKGMHKLAARGDVEGYQYAYLYDRVSLDADHKPQRYGSQLVCAAGVWTPERLEAPDRVDERRKSIGLKQTEAEYIKTVAAESPCG